MSIFMIDVESDGPIPGITDYSMICFGAVMIDDKGKLNKTFYGETAPISKKWDAETLAISGFKRSQHKVFEDPAITMQSFKDWVLANNKRGRPMFMADNNGYDFAFMHWYFVHFLGKDADPFGWSSKNLNDLYHGMVGDMWESFKHLRATPHDHNPVNDAMGNAEVFLHMKHKMGLRV